MITVANVLEPAGGRILSDSLLWVQRLESYSSDVLFHVLLYCGCDVRLFICNGHVILKARIKYGVNYSPILFVLVRLIIETSLHGFSHFFVFTASANLVISLKTYAGPDSGLLNIQLTAG
jgi:hypothetical protein